MSKNGIGPWLRAQDPVLIGEQKKTPKFHETSKKCELLLISIILAILKLNYRFTHGHELQSNIIILFLTALPTTAHQCGTVYALAVSILEVKTPFQRYKVFSF